MLENSSSLGESRLPPVGVHLPIVETHSPIDRRRAVRFPADDAAEIEVGGDPEHTLSGFLRDVSKTGMRVALPERLARGAAVKITIRGNLVFVGEVRYCREAGRVFYAGVSVRTVRATYSAVKNPAQTEPVTL